MRCHLILIDLKRVVNKFLLKYWNEIVFSVLFLKKGDDFFEIEIEILI